MLTAVVAWDASAHDTASLLTVTPDCNRVFIRLQVACRLATHNVSVVLNKLLCLKVCRRRVCGGGWGFFL
jgi:hypothetical protein